MGQLRRTVWVGGIAAGMAVLMAGAATRVWAAVPPLVPADVTGDLFLLDGDIEEDVEPTQGGCGCVLRVTPAGVVTIEVSRAAILAETGETLVNFSDAGIAIGVDGTLYFTEQESQSLLVWPPSGPLSTLATNADFDTATGGDGGDPEGVAFGSDGFLYVVSSDADDILRVNPATSAMTVHTAREDFLAIGGVTNFSPDGGIVGAEGGVLYVVSDEDADIIFRIDSAGTPTILAQGDPPFADLDTYITRAANGDLIVADDASGTVATGDTIHRVTPAGVVSTFLSEAALEDPSCANADVDLEGGIAFDSAGNFYVAEENAGNILRFAAGSLACSVWVSAAAVNAVTGQDPEYDGGIAFAPLQQSVLEIPTASTLGLAALGLALAVAGVLAFRRLA